ESIANDLQSLLNDGVFSLQEISSDRQTIKAGKDKAEVVSDAGATFFISGKKMPYNVFLKRINKSTSIPITIIHSSIVQYVASKSEFNLSLFNENSLSRFLSKFND
ncbi:hypothetical protein JZU68_06365, partial [bacterium]|nr:hypothetical protein [bacterium]